MKCQNCDAPIAPSDERCPQCGAKPLHRRVIFGAGREEFRLTAEDETSDFGPEFDRSEVGQFPVQPQVEPERDGAEAARAAKAKARWGGFFRRVIAFVVDLVVLAALSATLLLLSYIGYKVGLSANNEAITAANYAMFLLFTTLGWIALSTGYFVLFHGMDGKTIGKWMLGLRVVGPEQERIGYAQALLRWIGTILFAPLILGHLWILWSREKRGWHDMLARTWVVRD
ncbi:MAG TPA: RDD family protein [Candidatus Binatia bacterium]|nr:RDD family protein [Candidatus Binatia bacterium]